MAWYNLSNVTNRLFGAWLQSTTTTNAADGDNASTTSSSATSTAVTVPAVNTTLQYLQESTAVVAEQGFTIIGGAFVQGFGLLFERLNPMLESFVNGLLDAQMPGGPPRSRAAQRRLAAAAIAHPSAERDLEQQERPDYSTLPPAPPARAPSSARAPLSARAPPTYTPRGGVRPSPRTGGATGPANTLPTAPLPMPQSRQSTPRMPSVAEPSTLKHLQEAFKAHIESTASPSISEVNTNTIEPEAPADTESQSLDATASPVESEASVAEPTASAAIAQEEEVIAVTESNELPPVSVPGTNEVAEVMDVAQARSEATSATQDDVVNSTEGIREDLLKLALATQEDMEEVEQTKLDEIVAEVEHVGATDARGAQVDADMNLNASEVETLQTEEVKIDCEAENEVLDAASEPAQAGATETSTSEGPMETAEMHQEAEEISTDSPTVIDAASTEETN